MALVVLLAAGFAIVAFVIHRQAELFLLSVRDGRVLVVRGRVPGGFLHDARGMMASPPVRAATIRAVRQASGARLAIAGVEEARAQRLRNTFALYPASKLRSAPAIRRPTVGQVLGIAWLAWLLDGGRD